MGDWPGLLVNTLYIQVIERSWLLVYFNDSNTKKTHKKLVSHCEKKPKLFVLKI
jgi:hypothetical protein